MEDGEEEARYPSNPYPPKHRRPFPSSNRPNIPLRDAPSPPASRRRRFADGDEDDDDDAERYGRSRAMESDDEDEEDDDDDDDDDDDYYDGQGGDGCRSGDDDDVSSEKRGKRRKLDTLALGFEFARRVAPPSAPAASPPKPSARNAVADWSERATFVLLGAWGDLYLQNGRKSLRADEWNEVAKKVSRASKVPRSDAQCRNRVDTLKKKYKKEKARMAENPNSSSEWVYFDKMDELISSPSPPPAEVQQSWPRLPCGVDAGEYVFTSSMLHLNRSNGVDEMRDSPGDTGAEDNDDEVDEDDKSEGPPPRREKGLGNSKTTSFKMLADSIQKFGETYEKIEKGKRQQMLELERMRKEFWKDLEVHKKLILEQAQAEIAKLKQDYEDGEEEEEDEDGDDGISDSEEDLSG